MQISGRSIVSSILKRWFRALLDPRGPLGEVLSPSEVFKPRAGLPISSPHTQRAEIVSDVKIPTREYFVALKDAIDVPESRVRQVSAFVEEVWAPVYAKTDSIELADILRASRQLIGWNVTERKRSAFCDCTTARFERTAAGEYVHGDCGRARRHLTDDQFVEVMQLAQIQATDEFYNGYYETIKGNDPVVLGGQILRADDGTPITGGTMITRGRMQYRDATKNYVHWDKGFLEKRQVELAKEAARPVQNVRRNLERVAGEALPMWRAIPHPRYDRMKRG